MWSRPAQKGRASRASSKGRLHMTLRQRRARRRVRRFQTAWWWA